MYLLTDNNDDHTPKHGNNICNVFNGMELWGKYHIFLKTFKKSFPTIVKVNNKSYWEKTTNNIYVSATQQFFEFVLNNKYELIFDSGNTFLTIIR